MPTETPRRARDSGGGPFQRHSTGRASTSERLPAVSRRYGPPRELGAWASFLSTKTRRYFDSFCVALSVHVQHDLNALLLVVSASHLQGARSESSAMNMDIFVPHNLPSRLQHACESEQQFIVSFRFTVGSHHCTSWDDEQSGSVGETPLPRLGDVSIPRGILNLMALRSVLAAVPCGPKQQGNHQV